MGGRHNMEGFSRRELLKRAAMGAACLAFLDPWQASAAPAPAAPRAKAVIQVWLWGGACHLDTFDPKPAAGSDYCGPLNKPISTNADGIAICELLPLLARQADKYSLLRTLSHHVNAHETASYIVQTGRQPDRLVYPSAGAVVSLFKGYDQGYKGIVPPYVVLTEPQGRFSESGFLGPKYKPFATGGDPGSTLCGGGRGGAGGSERTADQPPRAAEVAGHPWQCDEGQRPSLQSVTVRGGRLRHDVRRREASCSIFPQRRTKFARTTGATRLANRV